MGDADLTIMLFFLFATTIVLAIPFYMTKFSNEPRIDMLLRRCCRILGIYLITLDASAVLIIADQAGIPLTSSITFFIWLSGFAGYTMMIFTAIKALIDYSKLSQEIAARKRMGDGDNE